MKKKTPQKNRRRPGSNEKKRSGRKFAGKGTNVAESAQAFRSFEERILPLVTEGPSAQPKSRSRDSLALANQLWEDFEFLACKLRDLSDSVPETVNFKRLGAVVNLWLLPIAGKNLMAGGDRSVEAIVILHSIARFCARFLEEASQEKSSREILMARASKEADWPVMLNSNENSLKMAKTYLRGIGVGTHLPFANMKDNAEKQWRNLALMLIQEICSSRMILQMQARDEPQGDSLELWEPLYFEKLFYRWQIPRANKWKQVLDLPPSFNSETCIKWWDVAKEMLKDYWESDPGKRDEIFRSVREQASKDTPPKRPESYATRQVQKVFNAIARKGGPCSPAW